MTHRRRFVPWIIAVLVLGAVPCTDPAEPESTLDLATATPDTPTVEPTVDPLAGLDIVEAPYSLGTAATGSTVELAENFRTVGEISIAASLIATVRIETSRYETFAQMPFTVSTALVVDSLKGSYARGDTLTVVETGGVHAGRSKDVPGEMGEPREVGFLGVPVMKPGEVYLLFLDGPGHVGPVPDGAFGIKAAVQGKVRLGAGGNLQFTGAPGSDGGIFAVPLALAGRPYTEVAAEIRAMVE